MADAFLTSHRLVHLDFKGAIPRIDYFEKIFPLLSSWGVTGLLIEYEDAFPYSGKYSHLQAPSAFSLTSLKQLLQLAENNSLQVIPLVQTFGHLEFVLKHDYHRNLREVDQYPNALCPLHENSFSLVTDILKQVLEVHPNINFIHIGADEVWHMGRCRMCLNAMNERKWSCNELFLSWITRIARWFRANYPSLQIIMWDDMMRTFPVNKFKEFNLGEFVQPMVWRYEANDFAFPSEMLERFAEIFDKIWVASAFKGSTGSTQFLPPIQHHINNHLSWLKMVVENKNLRSKLAGIALTGWQRYDHYAVLCELLPVAIPSLALCLRVLSHGRFAMEDHDDVSQMLGFQSKVNILPFPRPQLMEQGMTFPGHQLYTRIQMWSNLVSKYQSICNSEGMVGWFNDYLKCRNFTNPAQVENILHQLLEVKCDLLEIKDRLRECMLEVFYEDTVEEWFGCYMNPILAKIEAVVKDCRQQIRIGGRVRDYKLLPQIEDS